MSDTCQIRFEKFDLSEYQLFLKAKRIPEYQMTLDDWGISDGLRFPSRFASMVGLPAVVQERSRLPLPDFLFDDQRAIVEMALEAKRFAIWKDCGLGKTLEELEWSRQVAHITRGKVLIVTFNEVVDQTIEEARKFYGESYPIRKLESRQEMWEWCGRPILYTAPEATSIEEQVIDRALHSMQDQICLKKILAGDPCAEAIGHCGGTEPVFWHRPRPAGIVAKIEGKDVKIAPKRIIERANQYTAEPSIAIVNYEKFNPDESGELIPEIGMLAGLCLDESSRLKTGGGKQKWAIIKSSRGIQYKLSCTATPAPNDVMEFASQASFLERIRDEHDVIWTYFVRDPKTNEWTVKKHARPHFFRWMASWSIYVADPRTYGWRQNMADIPEPEFIYEEIRATDEQVRIFLSKGQESHGTADLFGDKRLGMVDQGKLLQAAKGFIYTAEGHDFVPSLKPGRVAEIAREQISDGRQTLIWCEYDQEVERLAEILTSQGVVDFKTLGGTTPKPKRLPILEDFRQGRLPLLVSKAKMLGWGMNFQTCSAMIFSGFSDSFESFYQAVRRSYRYGQTQRLRVFIPFVPQLEGPVLRNLLDKVARFSELIREQEQAYLEARRELN